MNYMNARRSTSARDRDRSSSESSSILFRLGYVVAGLLVIYLLVILVRGIIGSALLERSDRINMMFYDTEAILLSFGLTDDVHYIVSFSHIDKVSVPGGYGRYPVGSLGRLAQLEDDPDLMLRTISSMVSGYVDYYVYPKNSEVYDKVDTDKPTFEKRELIIRMFSPSFETNASFIDKLYISYLLLQRRPQDFIILRSVADETEVGETEFSEKRFLKEYKGFFYHQLLREESKEVQILYNSYPGAVTLSRVIEGQGIRVVDLSESNDEINKRCHLRYSDASPNRTVTYLKNRFGCDLEQGNTEGSDIIINMGSSLTEEWK